MLGLQLGHHLRGLGAGVLDVLGFVQHHDVPGRLQPAFAVALQQGIRGDDHIVFVRGVGHLVAVLPVQNQRAQAGAEALRFALPVAHQANRRNDECRVSQAACVFFDLEVGQGLQGFAQAHVVGQDAVQPRAAQELQPVQALLLVGAQAGVHALGQQHLGQGAAAGELGHQFLQRSGTRPYRAFAQGRPGAQGLHAAHAQAVAQQVVLAIAHQLQQGGQPGAQRLGGDADEAVIGLAHVDKWRQHAFAGGLVCRGIRQLVQQAGQPRQDVVAFAVYFHAQGQVEPG